MSISNVFEALETQAKVDTAAGISIAKLLGDERFGYYATKLSPDILKLAGCIGDANTLDLILHLAMTHPNQSTRLSALHAASNLKPDDAEIVWNKGLSDKSEMIRNSAKKVLTSRGPIIR